MDKDSKEEILKAFRLFDDDSTVCLPECLRDQQGKITFKNLKRVAKELGENLTDEELQVIKFRAFFFIMCLVLGTARPSECKLATLCEVD